MKSPHHLALAALATCVALSTACPPAERQEIPLPPGLALAELPSDQSALLRATLAISDGLLEETEVVLHVARDTVSGDVPLRNVAKAAEHTVFLRVYGRFDESSEEVLLGEVTTRIDVAPGEPSYVSFPRGARFEVCASGPDDRCALLFDANRNGTSNIGDLLPVGAGGRGIDPAPQPLSVDVAPSTLQFASGIGLGEFARQVIVLENLGENPVQIQSVDVIDAPGVALSLFSSAGVAAFAPRRSLVAEDFPLPVAPTGETLLAISFAPRNPFLATGAVQIVVEDTVTGVRHAARSKVIANADGDLAPANPDYVEPDLTQLTLPDGGSVRAQPFPREPLFSGLAVTSDNGGATSGLARDGQGALLVVDAPDGASTIALPADAAFVVDVPAQHRFSVALAGLTTDVDLAVVLLDAAGAVTGLACESCFSSQAGSSAEAAELENDSEDVLRVAVVLGRIEATPPVGPIAGALVASARVPFELACRVSRGPEFSDADPVLPPTGPLEGGQTVTLRGRGFAPGATVAFAGFTCVDVNVVQEDAGQATISCRVPPGSLEVGKNPATLVVKNPSVEDGGDGQAATLPEGYRYDPPAPRLETVTPDFAPTTGSSSPVSIRGTFFSARFGPPIAFFGDVPIETQVEDAGTLTVLAPAAPNPAAATTVALRVRNRLGFDDVAGAPVLGAASNALSFRYVVPEGAAPTMTSISPSSGPVDGEQLVTITGTRFLAGARVFFGVNEASDVLVTNPPANSLTCRTPASDSAGDADVVVINTDGQAGQLAGGFAYTIPPPVVDAVFPSRVSRDGGAVIVVNGSGFRAGVTAQFELDAEIVPASGVSRTSATALLVFAPPLSAGTWQLVVRNPDEQQAAIDVTVFVPDGPPPVVESVSPASGDVSGGNEVQILGRDFTSTATVVFGDIVQPDLPVVAGQGGGFDVITTSAPPSALGAGTVALQVINTDGQTAIESYTYTSPPTQSPQIARVDPSVLVAEAATAMTILGANFDVAGVSVTLGGQPVLVDGASSTPSSLSCVAPGVPAGLVVLAVRNPDGQSATAALAVQDPLVRPRITSVDPQIVLASAAGTLAVEGEGFDVVDVRVNGQSTPPQSATPTHVDVDIQGFAPGTYLLELVNADGQTAQALFLVLADPVRQPPAIDFVNPVQIVDDIGITPVDVHGHDLAPSAVRINGTNAAFATQSATQVRVLVDTDALQPGTLVVEIDNGNGLIDATSLLLVPAGTVGAPPPVIDSLVPPQVLASAAGTLAIHGSGFAVNRVTLNGVVAPIQAASATQIDVDVSSFAPGVALVQVLNVDGQSADALFSILADTPPPAPSISFINPASLREDSGLQVIDVVGDNLAPLDVLLDGVSVLFAPDGVDPRVVHVNVDTAQLAPGTVVVTIDNGGGVFAQDTIQIEPAGTGTGGPNIDVLLPAELVQGTGVVPLQIRGTGFAPASVTIGGFGVGIQSSSATQIDVSVDTGQLTVGTTVVQVNNVDGSTDAAALQIVPAGGNLPNIDLLDPLALVAGTAVQSVQVVGSNLSPVDVRVQGFSVPFSAFPPSLVVIDVDTDLFSPGTLTVTIDNGGGFIDQAALVLQAAPQPRIDIAAPSSIAQTAGVVSVNVIGVNLAPVAVRLNATPTAFTPINSTFVRVDVNAGLFPLGPLTLTVENVGASASTEIEIVLPPPVISSIAPNPLPVGAPLVQLFGSGFDPAGSAVFFSGAGPFFPGPGSSAGVLNIDASSIPPGIHAVRVLNLDGQSADTVLEIVAPPPPRIQAIGPGTVVKSGAVHTVTVTGTDFNAASVSVDGLVQAFTQLSPTTLSVNVDTSQLNPGTSLLTVTNVDGGSDSASLEVEAIVFESVTPAVMTAQVGGDDIAIAGSNLDFEAPGFVLVDGSVAPILDFSNDTVVFDAPAGVGDGIGHPIDIFYPSAGFIPVGTIEARTPTVFVAEFIRTGPQVMDLVLTGDQLAGSNVQDIQLFEPTSGDLKFSVPEVRSNTTLRVRVFLPSFVANAGYEVTLNYPTGTITTAAVAQTPLLAITNVSSSHPPFNGAFPRGVSIASQAAGKRHILLDVPGISALSFAPGPQTVVVSAAGTSLPIGIGSVAVGIGSPVDVELASGELPLTGEVLVSLRAGTRLIAPPVTLPTFAPSIAFVSPADVDWSPTPPVVVGLSDDVDSANIVGLNQSNDAFTRALPTGGLVNLSVSVEPLSAGGWAPCLLTSKGEVFGCFGGAITIHAPAGEIEPNNLDGQANGFGASFGGNNVTFGSVQTADRDRYFIILPDAGRLYVSTLGASGPCVGGAGVHLTVRKRGKSTVVAQSSPNPGGSECESIGLDAPATLPAGEYVVEANIAQAGPPTNYRLMASAVPDTQLTCGDGNVGPGEDFQCETGGGILVCPAGYQNAAAPCDPVSCTGDFSACIPNGQATCDPNGVLEGSEACDGGEFSTGSAQCSSLLGGGVGGVLKCSSNCLIDTTGCSTGASCGNGIVEAQEQCDDGNGSTGDGCASNCTLDACGNGVVEPGETCDDGTLQVDSPCGDLCL